VVGGPFDWYVAKLPSPGHPVQACRRTITTETDPIAEQSSRPASRAHRAWLHARRQTAPLPAHVTRAIKPSPARAHAHDPATWLPVPDVSALPSLDALLESHDAHHAVFDPAVFDAPRCAAPKFDVPEFDVPEFDVPVFSPDVLDLAALEALVAPSPARAAPHDADAWLPLPDDLHLLPALDELIAPSPALRAAVVAEADAIVADASAAASAVVAPSPARAEPHDAAAWLPLPDPESLVPLAELTSSDAAPPRSRGWRRAATAAVRPRSLVLLLLVTATAVAVVRPSLDSDRKAVVGLAPISVTVDLDGTPTVVTTTTRTATALGRQLHVGKLVAVRQSPDRLAAGATVVFRTRRSGVLDVDGQLLPFDSPSRTVAELLVASHVSLEGEDTTSPSPDAVLVDGHPVKVIRVGAATKQRNEPIAFADETVNDPTIPIGQTRVIREGKAGVAVVTSRARIENGVEVGETVLSKVTTSEAISRQIGRGTKADWHWDALANCESGGKWNTVDGAGAQGYHGGIGIYQPNWVHYGGLEFAPNAGLATREEQIVIGQRIFDDYGWDAWGCANGALGWN
jgi:uncharacterized protein YabE (DUF348 family)